jgi:rubrerythrin
MKRIIILSVFVMFGFIFVARPVRAMDCCSGESMGHKDEGKKTDIEITKATIYVCPMHPEEVSQEPGKCPKCGMVLEKKVIPTGLKSDIIKTDKKTKNTNKEKELKSDNKARVVYSCPMHPEVTSDKPGKCPKCGMSLEKIENK